MPNRFVDTNIFIEVFARTGEKSENSKILLKRSANLCTSSLVISEIEWVLRYAYELKRNQIVVYLKKILASDIQIDDKEILIETVNFYGINNVDWTDCVNMFIAKRDKVFEVYSYDKGLKNFDWIKRLEP